MGQRGGGICPTSGSARFKIFGRIMNAALISPSFPTVLLYAASLVLVMWTVVDVIRRPTRALPTNRKAAWILGSLVGWLLFGIVGAFIAVVYLVGPRRRMNAELR
jgi:hypothetical protein